MLSRTVPACALAAALSMLACEARAQAAAAPVQAQAKELQAVKVTGSRIRRADEETFQPITVIDRQAIERSGYATTEQLLAAIPQIAAGTFGRGSNNLAASEADSNTVSLRYLGDYRTLVLVNGRRWSTTLAGSTDLSTLPVSMIERIDVLRDGASTLYGADAIAGVINVITRDRFDGAQAHVSYGGYADGGGASKTIDLIAGRQVGDGRFVVDVQHADSGSVATWDRGLTRHRYFRRADSTPGALSAVADHGIYLDPATGAPTSLLGGAPHAFYANREGYNVLRDNYLLAPFKRDSIYTHYRYAFTPALAFRSTAAFTTRRSDTRQAAVPLGIGPELGTTPYLRQTWLGAGSYYNPLPGQALQAQRRLIEGSPQLAENRLNQFHLDLGLDGSFEAGKHHFEWDATYAYDRTGGTFSTGNQIDAVHLRQGLGPSFLDAGGIVRCGAPGAPIEGCVPIDLLSPRGGLSRRQLDYVLYRSRASVNSATHDVTANLSGDLMSLPAGELSFAAGYEYRKLDGAFRPDALASAGLSSAAASVPTASGYHVNEAYLELAAPLLRDLPGARELSIDVSGRYSRYSNFGVTRNYKYGFTWHPFSDLLIRGSYADGFRAPTIEDLYAGATNYFPAYSDPCDSISGAAAASAAVAANCAWHGVPAGYRQPGGYGAITTQPFTLQGNPDYRPETSRTKTLGAVYSPSWLSGLELSLDWYDITIRNTLAITTADTALDQCYRLGTEAYCGRITRDASGGIRGMNLAGRNLGTLKTRGYDLSAAYRFASSILGDFRISLDGTYLDKYTLALPGSKPASQVGSYSFVGQPFWRTRAELQLDWSRGPWQALWRLRYLSGLDETCVFADRCSDPGHIDSASGTLQPRQRVGAIAYQDLRVGYALSPKASIAWGVNNLFARRPPILYTNPQGISFDASNYDLPDRYFYMEYRQRL